MGNRIMYVQQVEIVDFRHLGHAGGQRQVVRRVLEKRVTRDFHLVIMDVGLWIGEPNRLRVRDEMDLMAAPRQFEAEFGRDHAAATVGWITGNADFHRAPALNWDRLNLGAHRELEWSRSQGIGWIWKERDSGDRPRQPAAWTRFAHYRQRLLPHPGLGIITLSLIGHWPQDKQFRLAFAGSRQKNHFLLRVVGDCVSLYVRTELVSDRKVLAISTNHQQRSATGGVYRARLAIEPQRVYSS